MSSVDRTFWRMLQDYLDDTGATEASVMRRAGLNKGAFAAWRRRGIPALPGPTEMVRLARALKVDYEDLLQAILHETGHMPLTTAELIEALDDEQEASARDWVEVMVNLGEYAEAARNDPQGLRELVNRDIHGPSVEPKSMARAVVARAVLDGDLHPPDIVWDQLEKTELRLLIDALWAARNQRAHGDTTWPSGKARIAAVVNPEERMIARKGTRRRSVTDRAQDEAGEESQDPGGVEPA